MWACVKIRNPYKFQGVNFTRKKSSSPLRPQGNPPKNQKDEKPVSLDWGKPLDFPGFVFFVFILCFQPKPKRKRNPNKMSANNLVELFFSRKERIVFLHWARYLRYLSNDEPSLTDTLQYYLQCYIEDIKSFILFLFVISLFCYGLTTITEYTTPKPKVVAVVTIQDVVVEIEEAGKKVFSVFSRWLATKI